jgi:hypothetical protein
MLLQLLQLYSWLLLAVLWTLLQLVHTPTVAAVSAGAHQKTMCLVLPVH